ncbi:MAG: glycosyltransferase family 39 protein [Candidatus Omnitrophica bacterium]|nr:glycosyltransferase family 39 protein [Candidatus Omnitrophota bacterium]
MRDCRSWLVSVALGLALGVLCRASLAGVVVCGASLGIIAWMTRGKERWLFYGAWLALGVRWLLILGSAAFAIHHPYSLYGDIAYGLFGDESYYALRAWWVLQRFLGEPLLFEAFFDISQEFVGDLYGRSGHVYALVLFYHLFGYSPLAVKGISALLGVLSGLLMHDFAQELAGTHAARVVCWLMWFWPSLLVWSVTNLKDPYALCLMCWALWAFQRWLRRPASCRYPVMMAVALSAYATMKASVGWLLAAGLGLAGLLQLRGRAMAACLGLAGLLLAVTGQPAIETAVHDAVISHINFSRDASSSYRLLPARYYEQPATAAGLAGLTLGDFLWVALAGTAYFLVVPLPGRITTPASLLVLPQMLCWYTLLAAAAVGLWSLLRTRWRAACLPLLPLIVLTGVLGATSGNIGTAFRHRDLVTPLYFLFAAVGGLRLWEAARRGRVQA